MVKTAEADIVCPAVAAEYPDGFLGEVIFLVKNLLSVFVVAIAGFEHRNKVFRCLFVCLAVVNGIKVGVDNRKFCIVGNVFAERFNVADKFFSDGLLTEIYSETVLRVVLKQRVSPCGTSLAGGVDGVRSCGCGTAPNGGASGRVGDVHSFAEKLRDETSIRSLGTSRAGAGELKQRLLELAALYGVVDYFGLLGNICNSIIESCLLVESLSLSCHNESSRRQWLSWKPGKP